MRLRLVAALLLFYRQDFIQVKGVYLPPPCEGCDGQAVDTIDDAESQVRRILKFLGACQNSDDCLLPSSTTTEPTTTETTTSTTTEPTTTPQSQENVLCDDLHNCGGGENQDAKSQVKRILKFLGACQDEDCFQDATESTTTTSTTESPTTTETTTTTSTTESTTPTTTETTSTTSTTESTTPTTTETTTTTSTTESTTPTTTETTATTSTTESTTPTTTETTSTTSITEPTIPTTTETTTTTSTTESTTPTTTETTTKSTTTETMLLTRLVYPSGKKRPLYHALCTDLQNCGDQGQVEINDAKMQVEKILKFLGACQNSDDCFTYKTSTESTSVTSTTTPTTSTMAQPRGHVLCHGLQNCENLGHIT